MHYSSQELRKRIVNNATKSRRKEIIKTRAKLSERGKLLSETFKHFYKSRRKKPIRQWTRTFNRHLQDGTQMVHKYEIVLNLITNQGNVNYFFKEILPHTLQND